jgi:class 3 adenylate cyclase/tetratricopeptide (TPR) repeat protein
MAEGTGTAVDTLLDRAVGALNRGDLSGAHDLAGQVLAVDAANRDAVTLLGVDRPTGGELRRLSLLFCDLVGSTELSARHEPEVYRSVVARYKHLCREVIEHRYLGHISHVAGDGLLAVFGLPTPHENDVERAVRAAVDIVRELGSLSDEIEVAVGERVAARAAVHKGLVFLDREEDEVYGLAANLVARLQGVAAPGTAVISEDVLAIVGAAFETVAEPARRVKGIDEPLRPFRVVAERPEAPTRGRQWASAWVDRTEELATLRERWRTASTGGANGPHAAHIVGEAGIGKSRLAALVADEADADGAPCILLLGSPFHADANFHGVRALIEHRCGLRRHTDPTERLEGVRQELIRVGLPPDEMIPLLAPVLDIPPEAGYRAVEADSRKLHEAIAAGALRYLQACAGDGAALVLVEDVHWCDDSTVETVGQMLRSGNPGLLVVSVSRDPAPAGFGAVETIALGPLDDVSARELVRSLGPEMDDPTCSAMLERGDGVPLFLEELARRGPARPNGRAPGRPSPDLVPAVAPDVAGEGSPEGPSSVPEALYEPLVARLYATDAGVPVAGAAATIGRDVDPQVLSRVVDLAPADLDAALTALSDALILDRAAGDDDQHRFRHELLRVVAYELQPPSRRRDMHGRVAEALVAESGDVGSVDWRLVAGHFDTAGRPADAIGAYDRAADGARRVGALSEARSLLGRAIELVDELADPAERGVQEVGLRLRRGFLATAAEGYSSPDAVRDYERCLELIAGDPANDAMFSTFIPLYGYYLVRGDLDRAQTVAEELRDALTGPRELYRPDNQAAFGTLLWFAGDMPAARDELEASVAGLATRRRAPDYAATYFMVQDGPTSSHANLALARFMAGDLRGAETEFEEARQRSRSLEFPQGPFSAASTESYEAWMLLERGDLAAADKVVARLLGLADLHGFEGWALIGATELAAIEALTAVQEAPDDTTLIERAETLEGLYTTWLALDLRLFVPYYTAVAGLTRAAGGDEHGAAARYDEALALADATGIHFYDAEVFRLQADLLDGDAAVARLRDALALARAQGAAPIELRIARDLVRHHGSTTDGAGLPELATAVSRFRPDAHYPALDDARAVVAAAS